MLSATIVPLSAVFKYSALRPASIQRSFEWQKPEAEQLLTDILRSWAPPAEPMESPADTIAAAERLEDAEGGEESITEPEPPASQPSRDYFLGQIVLRDVRPNEADIYDGLQRTTTLVILFSVIRDLVTNDGVKTALNSYVNLDNRKPKLDLGRAQRWLEDYIQKPGEATRVRKPGAIRNVSQRAAVQIAALFRDRLSALPPEQLANFANHVFENVKVCVLKCDDVRAAREIFVTTNNRGRALDESDIFKSQIFSAAEDDRQVDAINKALEAINAQVKLADRAGFWHTVDILSRRQWPGPDGLTSFGDFLIARHGGPGMAAWLSDMHTAAVAWSQLQQAATAEGEHPLTPVLRRLHICPWDEWMPVAALFVLQFNAAQRKGLQPRTEALTNRLAQLGDFCLKLSLADCSPSVRQDVFLKFIRVINEKKNPFAGRGPGNFKSDQLDRARSILETMRFDDDIARHVARWYECTRWPDGPPFSVCSATLEHVLPRSATDPYWISRFPNEDERYDLVAHLGNHVCLSWGDNAEAGRQGFKEKRTIFGRNGQRFKTALDVAANEDWTPAELNARTKAISDRLKADLGL